jgi:hypothetical protein
MERSPLDCDSCSCAAPPPHVMAVLRYSPNPQPLSPCDSRSTLVCGHRPSRTDTKKINTNTWPRARRNAECITHYYTHYALRQCTTPDHGSRSNGHDTRGRHKQISKIKQPPFLARRCRRFLAHGARSPQPASAVSALCVPHRVLECTASATRTLTSPPVAPRSSKQAPPHHPSDASDATEPTLISSISSISSSPSVDAASAPAASTAGAVAAGAGEVGDDAPTARGGRMPPAMRAGLRRGRDGWQQPGQIGIACQPSSRRTPTSAHTPYAHRQPERMTLMPQLAPCVLLHFPSARSHTAGCSYHGHALFLSPPTPPSHPHLPLRFPCLLAA